MSKTRQPKGALARPAPKASASRKTKAVASAKLVSKSNKIASPASGAANRKPVARTAPKASAVKPPAKTKASTSARSAKAAASRRAPPPAKPAAKTRQVAASNGTGAKVKTNSVSPPPAVVAAKPVPLAKSAPASAKPRPSDSTIVVPDNYRPTDAEPFMNALQRMYFRNKLVSWKEDILRQNRETLQGMLDDTVQYADLADRATSESDRALELRARDRQRKLVSKIDAALSRIEDGTYGYCEETGEPIGLKRLDARPIATLSLEAQERHERRERIHRGD